MTTQTMERGLTRLGPQFLRRAGFPVSLTAALVGRRADELLESLIALEASTADAGERLSEELHALVPLLDDDPELRRGVLALRRKTRKPRADAPDPALVSELSARPDAGPALDALNGWVLCLERTDEVQRRFAEALTQETQAATRSLEAMRLGEEFLTAVSDASPDFVAHPGTKELRPGLRQSRTVLSYAARAAHKTSPFGRLTTVSSPGSAVRERAQVSQSYARAWLEVLSVDPATQHLFTYRGVPLGGLDPATERISIPRVEAKGGFVWQSVSTTFLRGYAEVVAALGSEPLAHAELLNRLGAGADEDTVSRLLGAGVLQVVMPWSYGAADAWEVLVEAVTGSAPRSLAAKELLGLRNEVNAVKASRGRERGERKAALTELAQAALTRRGLSEARAKFELYLDVAGKQEHPSGTRTEAALRSLTEAFEHRVQRAPAYQVLVRRFVLDHGEGAATRDVWRWLSTVGEDHSFLAGMRSATAPEAGRVGPSMPLPAAAIAYQEAGESLVLGQVHAGAGGLVSRFAGLLDRGIDDVVAWAERLAHGGLVAEFVPAAGVNGLQGASAGLLPRLERPDDLPDASTGLGVDLTQLVLRHDAGTQSLVLETPLGRPVVPLYMGIVPSHLLDGVDRLLSILAEPWRFPRPGEPAFPVLASADQVVASARVERGGVTFRRATWSVPARSLPVMQGAPEEVFSAWGRWRRQHGLPPEVFVRVVRGDASFEPAARKPVWMDLRSVHCVAALAAMLSHHAGVVFTEAWPARAHAERDGGHVVEHLRFVLLTPSDDEEEQSNESDKDKKEE